mmetsp:Transcript_107750/g.261618  ORF Transcript_107750/g.261618 Transcript_107750/m.261618 type:complete len:572 (-) Transcript_107750:37-1752(-)
MEYLEAVGERLLVLIELPFAKYYEWWLEQWRDTPEHLIIEVSLIFVTLWVLFVKRSYDPQKRGFGDRAPKDELSPAEVDQMVEDWTPEPLAEPLEEGEEDPVDDQIVISAVDGPQLAVEGHDGPVLNLASFDFLGLGGEPEIKEVSADTLEAYGCGTCGPRGFYGTSKKHTDLEEALARFMKVDEAICYSDTVACVASAIAAFAKRGDVLVVDDGCNHTVQTGAFLSRAKVVPFLHNDMDDLERALREVTKNDRSTGAWKTQRRFIITEGLYRNYGDLCPLPDVIALRDKYRFRLICDETLSFGVLGPSGRGITEHFGLRPSDIEVLVASLATTLGSVGGFCAGTTEVVDHQRLSGAGYCYSASAPPFLCAAAQWALEHMEAEPDRLETLARHTQHAVRVLGRAPGMMVESELESPVVHMRFTDAAEADDAEQVQRLREIEAAALDGGVLVRHSRYVAANKLAPPPSLRVMISAALTQEELDVALDVVVDAIRSVTAGGAAPRRAPKQAAARKSAPASKPKPKAKATPRSAKRGAAPATSPARTPARGTASGAAASSRRSTRRRKAATSAY